MIQRLFIAAACAAPLASQAARPMITDDARLVDAGACQLESWLQKRADGEEFWALPACNPGGNFELTLGGAVSRSEGRRESGAQTIQGKTLFKPLDTNSYGIGLAAGYTVPPGDAHGGSPYVYIPFSLSLADDRVLIHTNLGALRDRATRNTRTTWGIGTEVQTSERLYLIAESYGQDIGRPYYQVGLRYWLIQNVAQLDTTYGNRLGQPSDQHWLSIGLRLISPSWF